MLARRPASGTRRQRAGLIAGLVLLAALVGAPAAAQDDVGGIRIGGFRIQPTATVSIARDSNVNADPDELGDWKTFTSLDVVARTRAGVMNLQSRSAFETLYFSTFTGMRNVGLRQEARADFALDRVQPFVLQSVARAISPYSIEINVPLERLELGTTAGADVRVSTLTTLRGQVMRRRTEFAEEIVFRDRVLSGPLNQLQTSGQASVRHQVTPMTALSFSGELVRNEFEREPFRNTNGYQYSANIDLQKTALISGSASVGRRHLDFSETGQTSFDGVVGAVDLTYVLLDTTRFTVRATRDASNTLDAILPYFLMTMLNASVTYQFGGRWDVKGEWRRDWLDYRLDGAPVTPALLSPRVDHARQYGFALQHRLNRRLRLTFDVQNHMHDSPLPRFTYRKLVAGTGFVYAF